MIFYRAGKALVLNLLESVYAMPEIRDKFITQTTHVKKYVHSVNRFHERCAAQRLMRRARQDDIIASLLVTNNMNKDMLARYQSLLYEDSPIQAPTPIPILPLADHITADPNPTFNVLPNIGT